MVAVAVPGRVLPVPRGLTLLTAAEQTVGADPEPREPTEEEAEGAEGAVGAEEAAVTRDEGKMEEAGGEEAEAGGHSSAFNVIICCGEHDFPVLNDNV